MNDLLRPQSLFFVGDVRVGRWGRRYFLFRESSFNFA